MDERIIPVLPPAGESLRLIIDTDAANEIDDLYAIALAIRSLDRFRLEGFVATHFAQRAGRESIQQSYDLLMKLLTLDGCETSWPVVKGGDPLQYLNEASDSDGARLIVEQAHAGSEDDPLWVVALGACSNLASAILLDPGIMPKVRFVFHARSEWCWPERSEQFNVGGDVTAARVLLESGVPLVWFDTGTQLIYPMAMTEKYLLPLAGMPAFLHQYRYTNPYYQRGDKGMFDLGDIAWMMQPDVCTNEVVNVPHMDYKMHFQHKGDLGQMLRLTSIRPEPVWDLFLAHMQQGTEG